MIFLIMYFWEALSNLWRLFWPISWWNLMTFCLSFPKWCNTYTLAEKIKALEHQTFSTHFTSKFMLFWITQKLTFFTHPNIKIGKNGNAPIHRRGFHVFFKNSWPSFTHLRPDIMALVYYSISIICPTVITIITMVLQLSTDPEQAHYIHPK